MATQREAVPFRQPILRAQQITKVFPGTVANDAVSIDIFAGEIHALLGENGAGKSTLVKVLYGALRPDKGQLHWEGRPVTFRSPVDAQRVGIRMVQQHLSLVPPFTVLDNLLLVKPPKGHPPARRQRLLERLQQLRAELEITVDPLALVSDLPLGTRQLVDLLKALLYPCKLLILDEPTAVLTDSEIQQLFAILQRLREHGCAIVLIAHKISEVMAIADHITVLRNGCKVDSCASSATTPAAIATSMVGRDFTGNARIARQSTAAGSDILLQLSGISQQGNGRHLLKDLTIDLRAGEIHGIAGVDGNGQQSLFKILSAELTDFTGSLSILESDPRRMKRSDYLRQSLALVPEDRHHNGLILGMTVAENAALTQCDQPPFAVAATWLKRGSWNDFARSVVQRFAVKTASIDTPMASLSGGNQQKVLLARELAREPRLLVLANPTRGLDMGAAASVHQLIVTARNQGAGVLLISADLEEILLLSDRISVLHNGKAMGTVDAEGCSRQTIGMMMGGELLS